MAYRINEHQRNTGKAADDGDEFVQVVRSGPGDQGTYHDHEKSKDVLLPLDQRVTAAGRLEDRLGGDFYRREKLQRRRQKDRERVDELNTVDEFAVLWHVEYDDGLGL